MNYNDVRIPNLRRLEVHITYRCNLRCMHCTNLIGQAPSNEIMPVEVFGKLLNDIVRHGLILEWLVLHGGEPTLHPQFEEIIKLSFAYRRDHNPGVLIALCTNGYGDFVRSQIELAEKKYQIHIENSHKAGPHEPTIGYHVPMSVSPADTGEEQELTCFQTTKCGIAFNMLGFWPCSPAASMARLFGFKAPVISIDDLTSEKLAAGFPEFCLHCGMSRADKCPHPDMPYSKTWTDAMARYNQSKHAD